MTSGTPAIRDLLQGSAPLVLPGVYDPISAVVAESLGFDALYLGGSVTSLRLATVEPLMTLTEQVDSAELITKKVNVPLIVDGHEGFGDPVHVTRAVAEYEWAGVAGIHIQDTVYPHHVHYYRGVKHLIALDEMVAKILQALSARRDADFLILARTEARTAIEGGLDEVRRRLSAFVEAGADALMPMIWDPEEAHQIADEFGEHLPLVWVANPHSGWPDLSVTDAAEMGYKVIIFPTAAFIEAARATVNVFERVRAEGVSGVAVEEHREGRDMINRLLNMDYYFRVEEETTEAAYLQ